jgi:hypothetical protein
MGGREDLVPGAREEDDDGSVGLGLYKVDSLFSQQAAFNRAHRKLDQ